MAKSKRELMREQLKNRAKESAERKDDSGRFKSYFKPNEDMQFWKPEKGDHIIDIIPYQAGKNDPHAAEGEWQYVLDIWIHRGVGVNEDNYVCPARNYDKPCPICEHQSQLRKDDDYDEDMVASLNPKRRVSYNIICGDSKEEEDKGVQVFEVSHWFMEEHIVFIAKDPRTGEMIAFADADDGKSLSFSIADAKYKDKKGQMQKSVKFAGHKFNDREIEISDDDLNDAFCLDECIIIADYDEIYKAYWSDNDEDEDESEPEKEVKTRRRNRTRDSKKEEKKSGNKCPAGGMFGTDLDTLSECNDCDVYDDCVARAEKIKEQAEEPEDELEEEPEDELEEEPEDELEEPDEELEEEEPEEEEKPKKESRSQRRRKRVSKREEEPEEEEVEEKKTTRRKRKR